MTIDELFSLCRNNKFINFNSIDYGKELIVEMPGNFEKSTNESDRLTEGLTPFVSRAFHDHINLNKSKIEEQNFRDNVPSSHLRPILANIKMDEETGELDFGSHDFHIEKVTQTDESGNEIEVEKTVYDEQPIGVIDGSKTSIEYDEDAKVNRAVLHGYLYNEYCQDAIDILERRGTVDCSIELSIRDMSFDAKEGVLVLNDFYVSGLTLLSAKTRPGMAGSNFKIEDFSINNESIFAQYESKMIEFQERLEKLESACSNKNNINGKEEIEVDNKDNFEEVTETEKVTETEETTEEEVTVTENESEETVDETSEDETVKENESEEVADNTENSTDDDENTEIKDNNACGDSAKKKKKCEEDETEESEDADESDIKENNACGGGSGSTKKKKKNSVECSYTTVDGETKTYAVSLDEKISSIHCLVNDTYAESDNTYYGVKVYDSYVIMEDWCTGRYFKQTYTDENDVYTLIGDRVEVYAEFVTSEELSELQSMRSNYSSIVEELNTYKSAEVFADKMTVFDDEAYTDYLETDEFKALMSKDSVDQYSKEQLAEKADATLGKLVKKNKTFSYTEKSEKKSTVVFMSNSNSDKESKKKVPYGGIFEKYNK